MISPWSSENKFPIDSLKTQTLRTADSHLKYVLWECHSLKSQENSYNGRINDLALVQNEFLIKILFSFRVKSNFPSTL